MTRCLALVVVLLATGCGSGGGGAIPKGRLSSLVLQPSDLRKGYSEFANGPQARSDVHAGPRKDLQRFGRFGGWISRFSRVATSSTAPGPLVVESRADLFPSTDGAKKDLSAYEEEYGALPAELGVDRLEPPTVGDDAIAFRFGHGSDRFIALAWREANATALVVIEGSAIDLAGAVELARRQQAHLEDAES